jgi:ribonuclease G
MSAELLINVTPRETRVALTENGILQELFIERANRRGLVGNVYKGRICRVLPGMQAAFVDIGLDRAAFLHASDVVTEDSEPAVPPTLVENTLHDGQLTRRDTVGIVQKEVLSITELLRPDQDVLVQVIKDPIGSKGARLTTYVSIPSCYLVYMPNSGSIGVSQRIEDEAERERLRALVRDLMRRRTGANLSDENGKNGGNGAAQPIEDGYIVRTAAESVSEDLLLADMNFLYKLWQSIRERARVANAPDIVHEDLPLFIRTLRELSGTDIERIRIDSRDTVRRVLEFTERFIPELAGRIEHYTGERPLFDLYGVEDEVQKALQRKVQLKSGGHLVIDQTEAMTTIDVNTGAFVGSRNLEETIFKTNLEASQAIARQLRLRNLGGIIIIDFIDMNSEEHKRQVLRALEKSLGRDHTKTHISGVSPLGLVQMTRKRTRESLEHILCEPCPTCAGRGTIKTPDTVCYEIFREILREARQFDTEKLLVLASPEVIETLVDEESASFAELEAFIGKPITLQVESMYSREQYDVVLM